MKPSTAAAKLTIQRNHAVHIQPRLIAEWEYNRFQTPTVTVTPVQDGDEEWLVNYGYPETIAEPNRPRTGIAKARSDSVVRPLGASRTTAQQPRFYPSGPDDIYRYWSSVQRSSLTNTNSTYHFDEPIRITVMYPESVAANKIVAGFETSYAKPLEGTVEVTVDGTTWETVSNTIPLEPDGTFTIWRGGEEWGSTPVYDQPMLIKGVRMYVYSISQPYEHLDVLQFGARLENDLTEFLISYETDFEVSDRSFIAPLGSASSNTASVTLSNIDGRFNTHNEDSLYYGMIDKKVRFKLDLGIDATAQGGEKFEYIREFTMWADGWGGQDQTTVEVTLKDSSVFLQEMDMPTVFFENMSVGEIIYSIMDRVGMTNYLYSKATDDYGQVIPFFWPEEDATVWDAIAELGQSTQTAIYFDEKDIMQIKARKAMYADKQVDWNFDAISNGKKLPDVVSAEIGYDFETNQVDVSYKPASYGDFQNGIPKMETVWEPDDDTIVLRSSPLILDLPIGSSLLVIRQSDVIIWPYEADVNIGGEILHYKGKDYRYYREDGALVGQLIYSTEEKNALDALNPFMSWKNFFAGGMNITARGLYGSEEVNHEVNPSHYTSIITTLDNNVFLPWDAAGIQYGDGFIRQSNYNGDGGMIHLRRSDVELTGASETSAWYGAKIRFPSWPVWKRGGIRFAGDAGDTGYYLEIATTDQVDQEQSTYSYELSMRARPAAVPAYPLAGNTENGVKGFRWGIAADTWYQIDINYNNGAGQGNVATIGVWIDGVLAGTWTVPPTKQPNQNEHRFGSFVRGPSVMDIDYMYAFAQPDQNFSDPDDSTWLDLRSGSYSSGFIERNYRYNFNFIAPASAQPGGTVYFPQRVYSATQVFDEFGGPQVHEMRTFKVQFKEENRPVGHSFPYVSNVGQVDVVDYLSDAFGATFTLANASRDNVIVHGEDTITYGADNSVDQKLFVYGRSVYQEEEKTLTKKDEDSIRKRGPSKTSFSSRFIQTEEMAGEIGQWIIDLWASGVDEVTLETFGNPFLQLGDLVTVNFPLKGMLPSTHKYFVVSIDSEYDEGYSTRVVLRRARL